MAAYQIPAPQPMVQSGDVAQNWMEFREAWGYYATATGLEAKEKNDDGSPNAQGLRQSAATLCAVMGRETLKVMGSLPAMTAEAKQDPGRILAELSDHYIPQRNVLFERYKFNTAEQQPNESCDVFIVRLRQLSGSCEFGGLCDSLIRDRLVIGTRDSSSRDRLLRERPVPDLQRCSEALRASELSLAHKTHMTATSHGIPHPANVDFLKSRSERPAQQVTHLTPRSGEREQGKCAWCGKERHSREACPAKSAKCNKCGKMGHFSAVCRSTPRVREVYEETVDGSQHGNSFLGTVSASKKCWNTRVKVNGHEVVFKLDTGAEVTILDSSSPVLHQTPFSPTQQSLRGADGTELQVAGSLKCTLRVGKKQVEETVYVLKGQTTSLLGKNACETLGLVKVSNAVYEVQTDAKVPDFRKEFPKLFQGLGCYGEPYRIQLREDVTPRCLFTARKVAHPLLPKVEAELNSMVKKGVISPVTQPTPWCSGMVPVPKKNGAIRVCVDLTALNEAVLREVHPMKSVDENLAKLKDSTVYSKLDANSGFWQVPLSDKSRLLTTFIAPSGRYCFNRLPFGISSAPEIFQRMMSETLKGLPGTICHMDDILICGKDAIEHDSRVRQVLTRLQEAGLTLNEKCEFSKRSLRFLGHIITPEGIQADPEKTEAIRGFPAPTNVTELQRFQGMVNQLAKFIPHLTDHNEPLRQLLRKDRQWTWGASQQEAFSLIKGKLSSTETLVHYDPGHPTIVAADACSHGLGAVLLQEDEGGVRRPVSYASRSLTETESRYAVIEKEALAATWACTKFSDYVLGLNFTLETDHKPLVPLLSTKDLSEMPPRILRFRLRLMRFSPTVVYVKGTDQITADALSRAPVGKPDPFDVSLIEEADHFMNTSIATLPATAARMAEISSAQNSDAVCTEVRRYCLDGWPAYMPQQPLLRPYWENRHRLTIAEHQKILLMDNRLVIPSSLQLSILEHIHQGHLGITKCRARAMESVWWPGLSKAIEETVSRCVTCAKSSPERREPLLPSSLPSRPWERVGSDLFEYSGTHYILVVDYYSRWVEVRQLSNTTAAATVNALKSIFAVHGIPDLLISDNGPQYGSETFRTFTSTYGFSHTTSSPRYPQANGEAERAVRTVKEILKKDGDPYLGLLAYRSTALQNGFSPSQLLMGRRLRSTLPIIPEKLIPTEVPNPEVQIREQQYRNNMAQVYNKRHAAVNLPVLQQGDKVWIRDQQREGVVMDHSTPRSYLLETDRGGEIRRNRRALIPLATSEQNRDVIEPTSVIPESPTSAEQMSAPSPARIATRSGRTIRKPARLDL